MAAPNTLVAAQRLCGVIGHCAELREPVEAQITIGEEVERLSVYVADIEDSWLLGLDYLKRSRTRVDFGGMTMRIRNVVVPLLESSSSTQVVAARAVSVPRRSQTRVRCSLSRRIAPNSCRVLWRSAGPWYSGIKTR